jgi:hypothetical protein
MEKLSMERLISDTSGINETEVKYKKCLRFGKR